MINLRAEWVRFIGVETPLLDVADNAHNLSKLIESIQVKAFSEGVLSGKKLLRQHVVNHNDGRRVLVILL